MDQQLRKAIFVSAIDYESPIQIGDHHLARQFARDGWKIAFISKPITPFHFLSKERDSISRRVANHKTKGVHHKIGTGEIWSYVPSSLFFPRNLPFLRNEFVYRYWHRTIFPNMSELLHKEGFYDIDLLYIRDPEQSYLLQQMNYAKAVFRIADNDAGFLFYNKYSSMIEAELSRKVDCVIYSAKEMENHIHKLQPKKSFYLPNGVDYFHFSSAEKITPSMYKPMNRPIVVYAGSIDFWFDFDLINHLTEALPNYSFVMIGPNGKFADNFVPRSNLFLLGSIPYEELPAYLMNADIGIIPFNKERFPTLVNSISPIKLLEFMACGLPVVSTKWIELENINSPATLCDSYQDFLVALEMIIASSPINKQHLQEFASKNDWSNRYQELRRNINL